MSERMKERVNSCAKCGDPNGAPCLSCGYRMTDAEWDAAHQRTAAQTAEQTDERMAEARDASARASVTEYHRELCERALARED